MQPTYRKALRFRTKLQGWREGYPPPPPSAKVSSSSPDRRSYLSLWQGAYAGSERRIIPVGPGVALADEVVTPLGLGSQVIVRSVSSSLNTPCRRLTAASISRACVSVGSRYHRIPPGVREFAFRARHGLTLAAPDSTDSLRFRPLLGLRSRHHHHSSTPLYRP